MAVKELRGFTFDEAGRPIDTERLRKLEDEIKVMHRLSHPNIVRYLGTSRKDGLFHILLGMCSFGFAGMLVCVTALYVV